VGRHDRGAGQVRVRIRHDPGAIAPDASRWVHARRDDGGDVPDVELRAHVRHHAGAIAPAAAVGAIAPAAAVGAIAPAAAADATALGLWLAGLGLTRLWDRFPCQVPA
jgi:hypothetical protein